jgi:hypothetical protein
LATAIKSRRTEGVGYEADTPNGENAVVFGDDGSSLVSLYRIHDKAIPNLRANYNVAPTQDLE